MLPVRRSDNNSVATSADPLRAPNRLPYRIERTADGSLVMRRRWWPLRGPRDVPLIEDATLGTVLFTSLLGGISLALAAMSGGSEDGIRRTLLLGIGVLALGTAIVRRARQAPFIVFDRDGRRLSVGARSWSFQELRAARPRALTLGDRDIDDFQVVLTLPTGEVLPVARYGSEVAARALVQEIALLLDR